MIRLIGSLLQQEYFVETLNIRYRDSNVDLRNAYDFNESIVSHATIFIFYNYYYFQIILFVAYYHNLFLI